MPGTGWTPASSADLGGEFTAFEYDGERPSRWRWDLEAMIFAPIGVGLCIVWPLWLLVVGELEPWHALLLLLGGLFITGVFVLLARSGISVTRKGVEIRDLARVEHVRWGDVTFSLETSGRQRCLVAAIETAPPKRMRIRTMNRPAHYEPDDRFAPYYDSLDELVTILDQIGVDLTQGGASDQK